jgi:hypothetical protein
LNPSGDEYAAASHSIKSMAFARTDILATCGQRKSSNLASLPDCFLL